MKRCVECSIKCLLIVDEEMRNYKQNVMVKRQLHSDVNLLQLKESFSPLFFVEKLYLWIDITFQTKYR